MLRKKKQTNRSPCEARSITNVTKSDLAEEGAGFADPKREKETRVTSFEAISCRRSLMRIPIKSMKEQGRLSCRLSTEASVSQGERATKRRVVYCLACNRVSLQVVLREDYCQCDAKQACIEALDVSCCAILLRARSRVREWTT